jgi:HemY protein
MAARGYIAKGDRKNAARVLKKAWEVLPHPDLAAAFAGIEPGETPQERLKRFRSLIGVRPESDESKLLLSELLVAAEDFPGARRAGEDVASRMPNQRSLALLAAISRGEGADDSIVRDLVAKAIAAPRGPQWVCDRCHAIHDGWQPVCDNCGSFDTLSWKTPPATTASPALAELLPLMEARPGPEPASGPEDQLLPPDEIARRAN